MTTISFPSGTPIRMLAALVVVPFALAADIRIGDGHAPLLVEVVTFFQTGVSPVPEQETIDSGLIVTAGMCPASVDWRSASRDIDNRGSGP